MLCVKCKKRTAVVFVSRMDGSNPVNEGYCLKCAKDMGIPQVNEMIKGMGMSDEDIEQFSEEFDQMSEQLGLAGEELDSQTAPSLPSFFNRLLGQSEAAPNQANGAETADKGKKKEKKRIIRILK